MAAVHEKTPGGAKETGHRFCESRTEGLGRSYLYISEIPDRDYLRLATAIYEADRDRLESLGYDVGALDGLFSNPTKANHTPWVVHIFTRQEMAKYGYPHRVAYTVQGMYRHVYPPEDPHAASLCIHLTTDEWKELHSRLPEGARRLCDKIIDERKIKTF